MLIQLKSSEVMLKWEPVVPSIDNRTWCPNPIIQNQAVLQTLHIFSGAVFPYQVFWNRCYILVYMDFTLMRCLKGQICKISILQFSKLAPTLNSNWSWTSKGHTNWKVTPSRMRLSEPNPDMVFNNFKEKHNRHYINTAKPILATSSFKILCVWVGIYVCPSKKDFLGECVCVCMHVCVSASTSVVKFFAMSFRQLINYHDLSQLALLTRVQHCACQQRICEIYVQDTRARSATQSYSLLHLIRH